MSPLPCGDDRAGDRRWKFRIGLCAAAAVAHLSAMPKKRHLRREAGDTHVIVRRMPEHAWWHGARARVGAALLLAVAIGCRQPKQAPPTPEGPSSGGSQQAPEVGPSQTAPPFVSLTAGSDVTCGIAAAGALYCWGRNDLGQVGDGSTSDQLLPAAVGGGINWKSVAPGGSHTCGLNDQGVAYCWGSSVFGELGNDTLGGRPTPTRLVGAPAFVAIASGEFHSCGLTGSGTLWCWGENRHGELGRGDTLASHKPVAVTPGLSFKAMSLSGHSTCALANDERLFCWGLNAGGALGFVAPVTCTTSTAIESTCQLLPRRSQNDMRFRRAALGVDHSCAVTDSSSVLCWGQNGSGQLGIGTRDSAGPTSVVGDLRYTAIAAGRAFSCALATSGDLYCWGLNDDGQLGAGSGADAPEPEALASASKFINITAGNEHACALTTQHEAYCWGSNAHGQLGSVVKLRSFNPAAVVFPATQ